MEESINVFQWGILRRYFLNIKWPKTLRNQDLYEKGRKKLTRRRLKWFEKMKRAPEEITTKVALRYGLSNYAQP